MLSKYEERAEIVAGGLAYQIPGPINGKRAASLPTKTASEPEAWAYPVPMTWEEWKSARPTPDCIVANYLFSDVGLLVAPGGSGKTTLILFEAVHIVLKLNLWGLEIKKSGPVLILTAEDSREMLVARLREICLAMELSGEQIEIVMRDVRISDVCAIPHKITAVIGDTITPNYLVDVIVAQCRENKPVLIVIDPAISFGVGESRVNDAEQALIEAARKLRSDLNCCVRYVHHTGKANAREKTLDQYSGRNGSALPDGCRMVAVMQRLEADEFRGATGVQLDDEESGIVLARPKVSYSPPQENIYIVRRGYHFTHVEVSRRDAMANLEATANQVYQLILEELKQGRRHSRNTLESLSSAARVKRQEIRDAVKFLMAANRIEIKQGEGLGKRGGQHSFLSPVDEIASPKNDGEPIQKVGEKHV